MQADIHTKAQTKRGFTAALITMTFSEQHPMLLWWQCGHTKGSHWHILRYGRVHTGDWLYPVYVFATKPETPYRHITKWIFPAWEHMIDHDITVILVQSHYRLVQQQLIPPFFFPMYSKPSACLRPGTFFLTSPVWTQKWREVYVLF